MKLGEKEALPESQEGEALILTWSDRQYPISRGEAVEVEHLLNPC